MLDISKQANPVVNEDSGAFGASGVDSSKTAAPEAGSSSATDTQKPFEQLSGKMPDIALTASDPYRLVDEIMDLDLGDGSANNNSRRSHTLTSSTSALQPRLGPSNVYHRHPRNHNEYVNEFYNFK
jgi:hypothetical protein